jgi:CyaY protein
MNEREFRDKSRAIFQAVLARLDQEDPDVIEGEVSAGVVKIRSAQGATFVLNVQPPLTEVWYAAGDRAWHYRFDPDGGRWVDPRNGDELADTLSRTVSAEVGRAIRFDLPA